MQVASKRQQDDPVSTAQPGRPPLRQTSIKPKVQFGQLANASGASQPKGATNSPWEQAPSTKPQWPSLQARGVQPTLDQQQQQQHKGGQQQPIFGQQQQQQQQGRGQQPTLEQRLQQPQTADSRGAAVDDVIQVRGQQRQQTIFGQQQPQTASSGAAATNDVIQVQKTGTGMATSEADEKRRALAATPAFRGGESSFGQFMATKDQTSFGQSMATKAQTSFGQSMAFKAGLRKSTKFPPMSSQPGSAALDNQVHSCNLRARV